MTRGSLSDWPGYAELLVSAAARSGEDESVTVEVESIGGLDVVTARVHFGFMGGSMGRVHGDRIASGLALAREKRLPFLSVIASGGARTQEGFDALIQMARTCEAVRAARSDGIPVLSYFLNPTTGGSHASYGASSDVILAAAGATIGFAGPRVVEALTGSSLDGSSHTAEAYHEAGLVDELVGEHEAGAVIEKWVRLVHPRRQGTLAILGGGAESTTSYSGWDAVKRARQTGRPGARTLVAQLFDESAELRGDRTGSDDGAMVAAVARLGERSIMVIGVDRETLTSTGSRLRGAPCAAGFRKARRAFEIARRWRMPVVTLIDTAGADASPGSDRTGLAAAISETMIAMLSHEASTIAVVTGEGGSGGAMALACGDRLLMMDDAVFEVIAPEGAAAILYRDRERAPEITEFMGLDAADLRRRGYSDATLPGVTTVGAEAAVAALRCALLASLADLESEPEESRLARRWQRYSPASAQVAECDKR